MGLSNAVLSDAAHSWPGYLGVVMRAETDAVAASNCVQRYKSCSSGTATPQDTTVRLYLGSYGGPRGGGCFL